MHPSPYHPRRVLFIRAEEGSHIHPKIQVTREQRVEEAEFSTARKTEGFEVISFEELYDVDPLMGGQGAGRTGHDVDVQCNSVAMPQW